MREEVVITEHREHLLEGYVLSEEERVYLRRLSRVKTVDGPKDAFQFDELKTGLRIQATSFVGVLELERVRIMFKPRFNNGFVSLMEMIGFVDKLPFFHWNEAEGEWGKQDFPELLIRYFLSLLDSLWRKGLAKAYVSEEDNLRVLRGRPDLIRNYRVNLGLPDRMYCKYDELVTNIPDNQVILQALEYAARLRLKTTTARRLRTFRAEFGQLCEPHRSTNWPIFHYHRLNAHYEPVHKIAKLIVDRLSVSDVYTNRNHSFFSLLVDMNRLFEDFVAAVLTRYLPEHYRVQASRHITDAIQRDGKNYRHIIPDIVIWNKNDKSALVLDAKYKPYNARKLDTGDLFQLMFYAQYHTVEGRLPQSIVIYPQFAGDEMDQELTIDLLSKTSFRGHVHTRCVSIEKLLELIRQRKEEELREQALRVVVSF